MKQKNKQRSKWRKMLAAAPLALVIFSCASTPNPDEGVEYVPDESETISLVIPVGAKSYFSRSNQQVVALIETGSSESLKQAASILHKTDVDSYDSQQRILMYLACNIQKILYPSDPISWEPPKVTSSNPYTGALDCALKGIYDHNTGNSDFLTTVLPVLVVQESGLKDDYAAECLTALTAGLRVRPDSVMANYLMARILFLREEYENSLGYVLKALGGSKNCFEINSLHAQILYRLDRNQEALDLAEVLLARKVQDLDLLKVCAWTSYSLGDLSRAEDYVLRVLQLQPENLQYVLLRARILMDKGDYIRASSLLDVYSRTDQTSRSYLLLRAMLQLEWNKNVTAAVDTIGKAVSLYPGDVELMLFAASMASSSNVLVSGMTAMDLVRAVLAVEPQNISAQDIYIEELVKQKDYSTAYGMSSVLVESDDAPFTTKANHVDICLSLDKDVEAWELAQKLYEENPDDEEVLKVYIKVLVGTGRRKQAEEKINALMPSASSSMKSFLYYEKSFLSSGDEAILSDLRASLTANPRNRDSLFRLYQIYYRKKDWKRAQYYLRQVVSLEPTNTTILQLNSELDRLQGK